MAKLTKPLDPRLGRIPEFDPRSRQYPVREMLLLPLAPKSKLWKTPVWLDQGQTPACTGFSMAQEVASSPNPAKGVTNTMGAELYDLAKQNDNTPGVAYDGSSVLGAVKGAEVKGYIGQYRWGFSLDEMIAGISYIGPAVIGINWYESMFHPDPTTGLVSISGNIAGGHAILVRGVDVTKKLFRLRNSWGKGWGKTGEFYITFSDMDRLLHEQGECCIPSVKRSTPIPEQPTNPQNKATSLPPLEY